MKVLMMVFLFPPDSRGGAELQCLKQARALAARGHEVTILTRWLRWRTPRREVMDGVRIHRAGLLLPLAMGARKIHDQLAARFASGPPRLYRRGAEHEAAPPRPPKRFRWMSLVERPAAWSFMREAERAIRSGALAPDVIHVHESHWLAGFAHWLGELAGVPVFCKEALLPVLGYGGAEDIPRREEWKQRRMQCQFIALTHAIARALAEAGIPPARILEIPNGVEIPAAAAEPARHSDAIFVGNITQGAAHKGFDILLQAWGRAVAQEPGMRLRLCGAGDREHWQAFAREQGCGDSVSFAGRVEDVGALYRQSGYFVLPSRKEGISNALLEALAAGLPAVVSAIPGNTVAVRDGHEGLVVPVGDPAALAEAMLRMHREPALRAAMGRAARQRAAEMFAIDSVAGQLERTYAEARRAPGFRD